ncbi:MAG TPA: universal stress protein [Bryobacteraceae bacterium]|nr:universal stress protein [Bryobacteraceae bacterium]
MVREPSRKSPEEFLRQCQIQEEAATRGHLKIFLGYASGVGKSLRMLDEARRRKERGQDVVIGAVQDRMRPEEEALLAKLEVVSPLRIGGNAVMDVEGLLRRHPAVCFIDGLAYDNPPGARNPTRWQDAQELLCAGIKVIASINIQYVDELRAEVEKITGKHVDQTVPGAFLKSADEIEIVDAPPEEPIERTPEEAASAQERALRLSRLREIALLLAADVVDQQLNQYLEKHGIRQTFGAHERILVCVTPRANAREMIDTARLISGRFHGELLVAYVKQPRISAADKAALEEKLELARAAGARIVILEGEDPVQSILDFATQGGITQIFIGHSQRSGLGSGVWGNPVDKLLRGARGMDVRVFPQ